MKRSRRRIINHNHERLITRKIRQEHGGGFRCSHCKIWVVVNEYMGTANRNHCNICLWSKHVDIKKGDRRAVCLGGMKPIGLTFRLEGGGIRGEITLIHVCAVCGKVSINRIAADDDNQRILSVFEQSQQLSVRQAERLRLEEIYLATPNDKQEIYDQLFGKGRQPTF